MKSAVSSTEELPLVAARSMFDQQVVGNGANRESTETAPAVSACYAASMEFANRALREKPPRPRRREHEGAGEEGWSHGSSRQRATTAEPAAELPRSEGDERESRH